jgi:uncharacterized protein with beta-barrel porin domain
MGAGAMRRFGESRMKQGRLYAALLATSSALALMVGIGQQAEAAACTRNNASPPIDNTSPSDCISFNNQTTFTGAVTNDSTLTTTANEGGPLPGTAIGISVLRPGTKLIGDITNNGTITTRFVDIGIGAGNFGLPPTTVGAGATLVGSIINNGTLASSPANNNQAEGIAVIGSFVTGSIINATGGMITNNTNGIEVRSGASIGGSVINNGTMTVGIHGFEINIGATITGSVANNGTITTSGSAGMSIAGNASIGGSVTNSGTINSTHFGIFLAQGSVAGSVVNSGTMNSGGYGIAIAGSSATLASSVRGNVSNTGTINANGRDGIAVFSFSSVGGAILNSNAITAARNGILVVSSSGGATAATVAGGITNSGTITSNGIGFAGIALVGSSVSQGVTNTASGSIQNAQGAGILVGNQTPIRLAGAAALTGGITNQGTINARTGIMVAGGSVVAGGITNSGSLTGTGGTAIDVSGAGAATVINQQGGTITGAILLSGLGDTVNVSGGAIAGNITGTGASGTVNFALGGGTFSYANAISSVAAVNVNSGTLFDNSSIAATTVSVNGGTLAPGQPGAAGTLNVTGSLVFASAAAYLITINGANAGKTAVTGPAALGGASVKVAGGSTINFGQTYTILTATGGVSGTFNPVVTFGNLTGTLTYDAHDVFLSFNGGSSRITPLLPPGSPQNVLAVAGALDNFLATGGTPPPGFLNLFAFTPQQLANALTQLSGEGATGAQESGFQLMSSFLTLLTGPAGGTGAGPAMPFAPERAQAFPSDVALAYASVLKAPPKAIPHWTAWGAAFGGDSRINGDPSGVGSHDLTARAGAVAAGIDYHVSPDTIVGFSLAGGGASWGLSGGLGGGRSDTFLAGLYGSQRWGQAYLSGAATFASYWMSTSRPIAVFGTDTLNASFNAHNFGGRLEGGFVAWSMPFRVIPYAAVQAQSFRSDPYSETGSVGAPDPFALSFPAQTATVVRSELGSRFDQVFAQADGSSVDLFSRAAWAHDWQSNPNLTATFIGLPAATFVVNGATPPKDLALLTSGAEWRGRNGWAVMGRFDGEFARGARTFTGTGKVSYTW